jgi:hypothetical protein
MNTIVAAALLLIMRQEPARCGSQPALTSATAFVECARIGTARYKDRSAAIADGYRKIGSDFPAMGEHWIRIGLVFDGRFEPSRPEVLNYVDVDGRPQLLGVGYAVPLLGDEKPPAGPAGIGAWHDHSRTIDDETVLPGHHEHGRDAQGPRLAMLHAWIWSPSPDGIFAVENWAIPFVRLKLSPAAAAPAVSKALSLAAGASGYFLATIEAATVLTPGEKAGVRQAMDRAQSAVGEIVARVESATLSDAQCAELSDVWIRLWTDIELAVRADARRELASLAVR